MAHMKLILFRIRFLKNRSQANKSAYLKKSNFIASILQKKKKRWKETTLKTTIWSYLFYISKTYIFYLTQSYRKYMTHQFDANTLQQSLFYIQRKKSSSKNENFERVETLVFNDH